MSDWYSAQIEIGGVLPKRFLKGLAKAITSEGGCLGDFDGTPNFDALKELTLAAKEKRTFVLCNDSARYGEFEELESFCEKRKISFRRQSAGYCEALPSIRLYIPAIMPNPSSCPCSDDGEPLAPLSVIRKTQDECGSYSLAELIEALSRFEKGVSALVIE